MPAIATKERVFALDPVLAFLSQFWALNHAFERTSMRMHSRIGVTAQQRVLLRVVGAFPGILSGQLARVLHLDPGTVSAAVSRLEQAGLMSRRREIGDGRSVALQLTRRGKQLDTPDPRTIEGALARTLERTQRAQSQAVSAFLARFIRELEVETGVPGPHEPPSAKARVVAGRRPRARGAVERRFTR